MLRAFSATLLGLLVLGCAMVAAWAAPPGPDALAQAIQTARATIADHEKTLRAYNAEMRATVTNDPASVKRREEIRILKQHYVREIENLKAKVMENYKKIQEFRAVETTP